MSILDILATFIISTLGLIVGVLCLIIWISAILLVIKILDYIFNTTFYDKIDKIFIKFLKEIQ